MLPTARDRTRTFVRPWQGPPSNQIHSHDWCRPRVSWPREIMNPPDGLVRGIRRPLTDRFAGRLLGRYGRLHAVEAQSVLGKHLPLQLVGHVGALAYGLHRVRPVAVPVRVV